MKKTFSYYLTGSNEMLERKNWEKIVLCFKWKEFLLFLWAHALHRYI